MNDKSEHPFNRIEPDDVTPEQYNQALNNLREVIDINPENIKNLRNLQSYISETGQALRTVVISAGSIEGINPHRILRVNTDFGNLSVQSVDISEHSIITLFQGKRHELSLMNVYIPFDVYKKTSFASQFVEHFSSTDRRDGKYIKCEPVNNPTDVDTQRGYLNTLKYGISLLLPLLPPVEK